MLSRRSFLSGASTLVGGTALGMGPDLAASAQEAAGYSSQPSSSRPNILIFMPDQQNGATVLPGHSCVHPNLDRFRAEAVTFNSAFCPAPHCCPSRASFQTGLYPSEHGVFNNVDTNTAIHPDPYPGTKYFSTALRNGGYNMAYSGKWHVGRNITATDAGWDNLNELEQNTYNPRGDLKEAVWKAAKAQEESPAARRPGEVLRPDWGNHQYYKTLPDHGETGYEGLADCKVMRSGIQGVRRLAQQDKPWCVMISNSGGHDPYFAPKKFVDMYKPEDVHLPPSFSDMLDDKPRIYQRIRYQYLSQMSDDETRQSLLHYWAKLSMQDALFGELLAALDQTGQADNTIVIYVSDHGDYGAAHGLWMKGVPSFREAYHIPCIIRWPKGTAHRGAQVDAFVSTVDFAPTILDAAGISGDMPLSGSSLLPWMRGETPGGWRQAIFSQMNGVELYYTQRITMTKKFKYVYNGFDYDELYDLSNDPGETKNLAFPDLRRTEARVRSGSGLPRDGSASWPALPGDLEPVREDLLTQMWAFAREHNDQIFNPYGTVAMAPFGPGLAY